MTGRVALLFACTAAIALSQGRPRIETDPDLPPARLGSPVCDDVVGAWWRWFVDLADYRGYSAS